MADIFICYPRANQAQLAPIIAALHTEGWDFFYDEKTPGGVPWQKYIYKELDKAKGMIVIVSKAKKESHWMDVEIDTFQKIEKQRKNGKDHCILAVYVEENIDHDLELVFGLNTYQTISLADWQGNLNSAAWQRFTQSIRLWQIQPNVSQTDVPSDDAHLPTVLPPDRTSDIADTRNSERCNGVAGKLAEHEAQSINPQAEHATVEFLEHHPLDFTGSSNVFDILWIPIPSGSCTDSQGEHRLNAFEISCFPVTQGLFQAFVDDRGYDDSRWWNGVRRWSRRVWHKQGQDIAMPVTWVSWYEACAFCRWLGHNLGRPVRLPTALEWIRAARGDTQEHYSWIGAYQLGNANINEKAGFANGKNLGKVMAVGAFPLDCSMFGVRDMVGNVHEWCQIHDPGEFSRGRQTYCGGAFLSSPRRARVAVSGLAHPDLRSPAIGFRVVTDFAQN